MEKPADILLSEQLTGALYEDRWESGRELPFACRPLVARSAERKTVFAVFTGQIGLADVPVFKSALHDLTTGNPAKIIVDFADISLTKSAVGALVSFAALIHGLNKRLYLYRPSGQARAVLKELQLSPFFSFLEKEDDIIATLVI